jgi:hypothetical protein
MILVEVAAVWFVIGISWGFIGTIWWNHHQERRYRWKCPGCPFQVWGPNRSLVDFVILEHTAHHE